MNIDLNRLDTALTLHNICVDVRNTLRDMGKSRVSPKYDIITKVICSNISAMPEQDRSLLVPLSDELLIPDRYNKYKIRKQMLRSVIEAMEQLGYVSTVKGKKNISKTILKPTTKYYSELPYESDYLYDKSEYIILKDADKNLKDYKDDKFTRMSRVILKNYNEMLDNTVVMLGDKEIKNQYYRIFNEDFKSGGRYYRAKVLDMSSSDRLNLTIDGEEVCEVDFSCMHVALLLGKQGEPLSYDPYNFLPIRKDAKKVLNIILCCDSKESARKAIQLSLNEGSISSEHTAKDIIKFAEECNSKVKNHFYCGSGLKTMYSESEIATDVISTCVSLNIPVLVIHDGFVCKKSHVEILSALMVDAFRDHVGHPVPVSLKRDFKEVSLPAVFFQYEDDMFNIIPVTLLKREYTEKGTRKYKL